MLVSNSLNHADRDDVEERNEQREDERPDREVRRPALNDDDTEHKHADEQNAVPPLGYLGVHRHKTRVDIGLLVHRSACLRPNLLAEVQECVGQRCRDRREAQSVLSEKKTESI